MNIIQMIHCNT